MSDIGTFTLKKTVKLSDLKDNKDVLEEADFTDKAMIDGDLHFFQFKYTPSKTTTKQFKMERGVFHIEATNSGLKPRKIEVKTSSILENTNAVTQIRTRIDAFFDKLHVYKEEGIDNPKRGMLVHSAAGVGKTVCISRVTADYVRDHNTCVMVWPSDAIHPDDFQEFLGSQCDWEGIDRFLLIIEDLGGGSDIWGSQQQKTPASLLNFLDGVENIFKKPSFLIATSNNADSFQSNIISRPGRFDVVIGLALPDASERIALLKFFAKDRWNYNNQETRELEKLTEGFAAAHLKEVYLRSRIDDKTMFQTANELKKHIEQIAKGLSLDKAKNNGSVGFGARDDDDF